MTCAAGRQKSPVKLGPTGMTHAPIFCAVSRVREVITAPLGKPVVPEV